MWEWIGENAGTVGITALLIGVVAMAIVRMVRDKKRGTCSCGCAHCALSSECHKTK